ncbi:MULTISPECIES: thioredoxin family protein [Acidobacteriaceae]|uniref:DUF1223 domain-containing protein n=1 Tax=Acidobacteriaceae TaxID=204434 RepID=UPI00131BF8E9|nr:MULTISPECIES: DUF1223 domain-containing protein [Acidobacteriaceae]MDW5266292.1 DUF1223 domain-containing protein [Edaphobacter sp.]
MLRFRPLATVDVLLFMLVLISGQATAQTAPQRSPVLVELFTSEGCSSCPPADALLAKLEQVQPIAGTEIIALGEHVDYWDQLGWHDRFSSHQYTERQNQYRFRFHLDDVYTPQMVIDGTEPFVGNDAPHIVRAISSAGNTAKINLALSKAAVEGSRVSFTVSSSTPPNLLSNADLYAALVDPTDTTNVQRGENKGQVLHHAAVVRSLQKIGKLNDLASGPLHAQLVAPANSEPATMRIVVFAQRPDEGAVVGAVSMPARQ